MAFPPLAFKTETCQGSEPKRYFMRTTGDWFEIKPAHYREMLEVVMPYWTGEGIGTPNPIDVAHMCMSVAEVDARSVGFDGG